MIKNTISCFVSSGGRIVKQPLGSLVFTVASVNLLLLTLGQEDHSNLAEKR